MANWCYNSIVVEGIKEDLRLFDEQFKGKHISYRGFSSHCRERELEVTKKKFEEKVKTKEILKYKMFPTKDPFSFGGEDYYDYSYIQEIIEDEGYSFRNIVPMSEDDFLNGVYLWARDKWGTDRDACSVDCYKEDNTYIYSFETAWSPCVPVVKKMARSYPMLKFTHRFDEPSDQIAGIYEYENGELNFKKEHYDIYENVSYREFLKEHFGNEFYTCLKCEELVEEDELGDDYTSHDFEDNLCPFCGSKEVIDPSGEKVREHLRVYNYNYK